jgi:hypothetical protein
MPSIEPAGPRNLLIDSTDIKVEGKETWPARKHLRPERRMRRKVHIAVDKRILKMQTIQLTAAVQTMQLFHLTRSIKSGWIKSWAASRLTAFMYRPSGICTGSAANAFTSVSVFMPSA